MTSRKINPIYFYLGIDPRFAYYTWLPDNINIMYSASSFWDGRTWRRRGWLPNTGSKWLDSGGFSAITTYGQYPFSPASYLNLVAQLKPHFYATMDTPCLPHINPINTPSIRQRIDATVENTRTILDMHPMVGPGPMPVPVIQGLSLDDYHYCIDQYHKFNCIHPYMAVGSMVRKLSDNQLSSLVSGIYDYATQAGASHLHWFGLKLDRRLIPLSHAIFSRDSSATLYDYRHDYSGFLTSNKGRSVWPRTKQERRERVLNFLEIARGQGLRITEGEKRSFLNS